MHYLGIWCLNWGVSGTRGTRQSRTNIFLKTSVCAAWSEHLHETKRINSSYTKSLRIFFGGQNIIFVDFWIFWCLETLIFDFIKKNFLVTQIFKCLTLSNYLFCQDQYDFVQQILNWYKIKFSCTWIKIIKHLAKKFLVCPGTLLFSSVLHFFFFF